MGLPTGGAPKKSKTQVKIQSVGNVDPLDSGLNPAARGTPAQVAERDFYAQQGKLLHDQLKKNKSSGLKP